MSEKTRLPITARSAFGKIWALTKPYWRSEEKGMAWLLLVVVVALNLGLVYLAVLFNKWNNNFYNSLQSKNFEDFKALLWYFGLLAAIYIAAGVYQTYLRQMLQIRWRQWLTAVFIDDWLAHRTYYRLELTSQGTDNPDQRIQEDLDSFTQMTLSLAFDLMRSVVTLFSFLAILWGLSGPMRFTFDGTTINIPGYMVWFALVYSVAGTWLTHKLGRPLIRFNFLQQRYEADLRFGLVRLRENAEGVAFYRGEPDERRTLLGRFGFVFGNFWNLMNYTKRLNFFTIMYAQFAIIFPFVVAAPRYFSGKMQLGGLMQTASAFGQVQGALSWFVDAYTSLAAWKATVDRLTSFHEVIQEAALETTRQEGISVDAAAGETVAARDLDVGLPDGRVLLSHVDCTFRPGEDVLLTGPSGSGKSTLFRALAGIWPFGKGKVEIPRAAHAMFLPQRPYLPLGTLRSIVAYPSAPERFDDAEIRGVLERCGLAHLVLALDESHRWSQRLSPGEQQRLAFARVLLNKPEWLFLDEATSALDEAMERRVYALVRDELPDTTMVSIAHRPSVADFHGRHLELTPGPSGQASLVELPAGAPA